MASVVAEEVGVFEGGEGVDVCESGGERSVLVEGKCLVDYRQVYQLLPHIYLFILTISIRIWTNMLMKYDQQAGLRLVPHIKDDMVRR